jgi:hypothetical protein
MAEMIPPALPASATASERKIFDLLKRLPDDCLAYYEPRVGDRYPDFVVIMPDLGVLVVEVKAWRGYELVAADSHRITHRAFGEVKCVPHPARQARGYMTDLMDNCRRYAWGSCLLNREGQYRGAFCFPFSYAVLLTNVSRDELDAADPALRAVFPGSDTLTRDIVDRLVKLDGKALESELGKRFAGLFRCALSDAQLKVLRAIMNPVVVIEEPRKSDASDIKVLDTAQEVRARFVPDGHQIVYGVAGSGKTAIVIARAKFLAEDRNKKILVLCYNNLLAQHIRLKLADFRNVSVFTFHAWARKNGIDRVDAETLENHAQRFLLGFAENAVRDAGGFDAVIIDEAQLLPCDWLKCASLALKEQAHETASLMVVGDGTQSFFKKRPFSWKDAGIAAAGRTTILKRNYRNTAEILRLALPFAAARHPDGEEGPRASTPLPECVREGPAPELIALKHRGEECDFAAAMIRSWLLGGIAIRGKREMISPSDIGILYPTPGGPPPTQVAEKLRLFTEVAVLQTYADRLDQPGVRIVSIQRATGLQFRIVILLWTDLLPSNFADRDDRTLLYLGMTRAEDVLVILHSGRSKLVDEIQQRLSGQNATAV